MNFLFRMMAVLAFAAGLAAASQSLDIPVSSGGSISTRHLNFYAPAGLGSKPSLVVLMHGAQGNGNNLAEGWGWDSIAMREKIVVATPSSVGSFWDLGGNSDVDFVLAIVDTMARRFNIDRNRVYASGWSMGGMMSYYLACHVPETFAAIGPSSGYLIYGQSGCSDKHHLPIYHIHGIWDDFVKYSDLHTYLANNWLNAYGCPATPDSSKPGLGATQLENWSSCKAGGQSSEIHLESYWKAHGIGSEEAEVFWNFLHRYSLNAAPLPAVTLYQKVTYKGELMKLSEGSYNHVRLAKVGLPDSSLLSLRIETGLTVELFADDDFQTSLGSYQQDAPDLSTIRNSIRALRISVKPAAPGGTFYQYADYSGLNTHLTVGEYTLAQLNAAGIPDNAVNSMKLDSGVVVQLYDEDNFQTPLGTVTSSQPDFSSLGFANKVTSLRISKATTTALDRRGFGSAAVFRYVQGRIETFPLLSGPMKIVDARGGVRVVNLVAGRGETGNLPAGMYRMLTRDGRESAAFAVVPGL